jgi:predicted GNAT superfamily acetyltransferase
MSSLRTTTSAVPNADLLKIRTADLADFESVLALNFESEQFLSPLTRDRLDVLHQQACLHQVIEIDGKVAAFVLALREGEDYDSVNYRWFLGRYERFMYVDRVVVSGALQGRGLGRVLYEAVFAYARVTGVPVVTCEYDIDPPNPASARFHRAFGFLEVGRQRVVGGKKMVSLQVANAPADSIESVEFPRA